MTATMKQKIGLVFFGIILFLVLLEGGLRVGGFILSRKQAQSNKIALFKKSDYRILCLGESTTQNQWPSLLEKVLNKANSGISFSVIDKGDAGANSAVILFHLLDYLERYSPDMVITMMGVNDDISTVQYEGIFQNKIYLFMTNIRIYQLFMLIWQHVKYKLFYEQEDMKLKILDIQQKMQGVSEQQKEFIDNAEKIFRMTIKRNPNNYKAYMVMGQCYLKNGFFKKAEAMFKRVLAIGPNKMGPYLELQRCYLEWGKKKEYEEITTVLSQMALWDQEKIYYTVTQYNYQKLKEIVMQKGMHLICVQYPLMSVLPLKKILNFSDGIFFVDNEKSFRDALKREGYNAYFTDHFTEDFGHCTEKGNQLIAQNIADVILTEVVNKKKVRG